MENTLENRLKFYAQHLGQNIIIDSDCFRSEDGNDIIHTTLVSVSLKGIECDGWIPEAEHTALELKPLSLITDEDLKMITRIKDSKYSINKINPTYFIQEQVDYLRSKRYAISWMGLSVEKLQEYGWIKVK